MYVTSIPIYIYMYIYIYIYIYFSRAPHPTCVNSRLFYSANSRLFYSARRLSNPYICKVLAPSVRQTLIFLMFRGFQGTKPLQIQWGWHPERPPKGQPFIVTSRRWGAHHHRHHPKRPPRGGIRGSPSPSPPQEIIQGATLQLDKWRRAPSPQSPPGT